MTDIKLKDVPKSKNILEHIEFTTDLTHGSGKEYGFNFCKLDKKIVVDRVCKGTECVIDISPTVCSIYDHRFHTHPNRKLSDLSVGDIAAAAFLSHHGKKPIISCVKSEFDNNTICKKTNAKKFNVTEVLDLHKKFEKEPTFKKHEEIYNKIEKIVKPETIIFNSKTGKLLYHHNKPKE